ncbi:MAG: hypothetical protein H6732_01870 [Alphaproteobacteria bacterium]|nr:hypothetical protein [Alphaproteobacteria bacterium]
MVAGLGAIAVAGLAVQVPWRPSDAAEASHPPPTASPGAFVGSQACGSCHPGPHASWQQSFHRTMTQVATPAKALAPFAGEVLSDRGRTLRMSQDEGRLRVEEAADGTFGAPRAVEISTGSHHLQVYWVRADDGTLTQLPFAWRVAEARWIPNADSFLVDPDLAARGSGGRWDTTCFRCHATGWSTDDPATGAHDQVAVRDLGIACEACHGPAAHHVAHNRNPLRRWGLWLQGEGDPTVVHPHRLDAARANAVCAQCHSEAMPRVLPGDDRSREPFLAGGRHEDHFSPDAPERLHQALHERGVLSGPRVADGFWPDGTGRVAGREHTAMRRSACAEQGELACTDCHQLHGADPDQQLAPAARTDAMCTGCHPDVAAAGRDHTHHAPDGEASRCVSCHMPRVTYGLFAARRSHRISSPTASGADAHARPNACNLCHLDQTLAWTAEALAAWHDQPRPELPPVHTEVAASLVWALTGDAVQRALIAWHLGDAAAREASGDDWQVPVLSHLLDDRYAIVRALAGEALFGRWATPEDFDYVAPAEARRAFARRALDAWPGGRPRAPAEARQRLLQPDGQVDLQRFSELAAQRDDTPVGVTE